jgi:hypothetical protein
MTSELKEEDLAGVLDRLRALEDERAIQRTLFRYGYSYDAEDHERWVECFTDDAEYDVITGDGVTIISCRGREDLEAQSRGHKHALGQWTQHLLMEPMIDIEGDRATSVAYFVRTDDRGGIPYISACGRYHDELRRCDDGQWRFSRRVARMEAQDTRDFPSDRQ